MKAKIKAALAEWLGLPSLRAELAELNARVAADRNQIIGLQRRLEQVEAQAAGHAERVSRVEKQNLPVRYVADPVTGGLSEVR
jgi:hypothetical protein